MEETVIKLITSRFDSVDSRLQGIEDKQDNFAERLTRIEIRADENGTPSSGRSSRLSLIGSFFGGMLSGIVGRKVAGG